MNKQVFKSLLLQLIHSPKEFPVEALLGLSFFVISFWHSEYAIWDEKTASMVSGVNADILWFFIPLVVLTFWLGKVNRWIYYASFFLFLPLMALDLNSFFWTYGFFFTYVLAGILLLTGTRSLDNRPFAAHVLHVVTQLFFGIVITWVLTMAVLAIVASFLYIFGIDEPAHLYEHLLQFIWFVISPQVCCTLIRRDEDKVEEPAKVLRLILNFILSPAIIIYTVILYTYFIKIVFEWDLPKGGVAWMVMGFITATLVGRLVQDVLNQRYFDWFYRYFTWIAIPPLIMYWVGSIYRIRLYSFTESRFYLMVAGALMTLFVIMLLWHHSRRFQLMAIISGLAIILFTYIPGISAKSIGLVCQKHRLAQVIDELQLMDPETGKLRKDLDVDRICTDSLLCEKYTDASSMIDYVRKEVGREEFTAQYGEWNYTLYSFNYSKDDSSIRRNTYRRTTPLSIEGYFLLMASNRYFLRFSDGVVSLEDTSQDSTVVLEYPIADRWSDSALIHTPEQLLVYENDSLMLVLDHLDMVNDSIEDVSTYDFLVLKKD